MEKHFCDKCGKEVPVEMQKNYRIGMWVHIPEDEIFPWKNRDAFDSFKNIYHDLCQECAEAVEEFITGCKIVKE